MKVKVIEESGYAAALHGVGLSFGLTSGKKCFPTDIGKWDQWQIHGGDPKPYKDELALFKRLEGIAAKLAHKNNAENKFLRQISVVIDVNASLTWWKQMDQYRIGCTTQSESSMHCILKKEITQANFEHAIFPETLRHLEELRQAEEFEQLVYELPCGWLQRRILTCNYAVLQNIYNQRRHHKLKEWHIFCYEILSQVLHPEFIKKEDDTDA